MDTRTFTYQTRIDVTKKQAAFLRDFGCLYGTVERSLHAEYARGHNMMRCKSSFIKRYGITARQFNSIRMMLQGKHRSILALQDDYIKDVAARIKKTQKRIKVLAKKQKPTAKDRQAHFQKKRLLDRQKIKLSSLQADKKAGRARLCFGSKSLFKKQHHLAENGYTSHEEWRKDWQERRSNQFFLVGSKDETSGNQSAVAILNEQGNIDIRVRAPDSLIEKHGKFITITNVHFAYGHEQVLRALLDNYSRQSLKRQTNRKLHGDMYLQHGVAINYRFLLDDKGWRLFVSLERKFKEKSDKSLGAIGVDINAEHLAVCEIDSTGNKLHSFNVPCCTYGKSQNQAKAIIGDACKVIVEFARQKNKPIIIEKLDFSKKKQNLKSQSNAKARMLSGLAYAQIKHNLESRAFRQGIQLYTVNPAYSSVIGRVKFARQYTMSIHQSAALVIARRFYSYSERLPKRWDNIPSNTGSHMTLPGLVKNQAGHLWKSWAIIHKQLKMAHAALYQMLAQPPVVEATRLTSSSVGTYVPADDEVPF